MTPEQFCYWLQGYTELNNSAPDEAQWKSIKEHLQTVFYKITPPLRLSPYEPFCVNPVDIDLSKGPNC
jgi:hypothetical protein